LDSIEFLVNTRTLAKTGNSAGDGLSPCYNPLPFCSPE